MRRLLLSLVTQRPLAAELTTHDDDGFNVQLFVSSSSAGAARDLRVESECVTSTICNALVNTRRSVLFLCYQ